MDELIEVFKNGTAFNILTNSITKKTVKKIELHFCNFQYLAKDYQKSLQKTPYILVKFSQF